jgi:hypothetical protein
VRRILHDSPQLSDSMGGNVAEVAIDLLIRRTHKSAEGCCERWIRRTTPAPSTIRRVLTTEKPKPDDPRGRVAPRLQGGNREPFEVRNAFGEVGWARSRAWARAGGRWEGLGRGVQPARW